MAQEAPMTPQEADALKAEITKAVDAAIQPDMTQTDALKAVSEALMALAPAKDLGGMGMDQGMGDMEGMAEDTAEGGSEKGAGE